MLLLLELELDLEIEELLDSDFDIFESDLGRGGIGGGEAALLLLEVGDIGELGPSLLKSRAFLPPEVGVVGLLPAPDPDLFRLTSLSPATSEDEEAEAARAFEAEGEIGAPEGEVGFSLAGELDLEDSVGTSIGERVSFRLGDRELKLVLIGRSPPTCSLLEEIEVELALLGRASSVAISTSVPPTFSSG